MSYRYGCLTGFLLAWVVGIALIQTRGVDAFFDMAPFIGLCGLGAVLTALGKKEQ